MTDLTASGLLPAESIDTRILAHLLTESIDLLERAQVQAALGGHSANATRILSDAIGQIACTCGWLTQQMNSKGVRQRLPVTLRSFDADLEDVSEELQLLSNQAQRLYDRACKLDSLLQGTEDSLEQNIESQPIHRGHSAEIIFLDPARQSGDQPTPIPAEINPVLSQRSRLNWVFARR